MQSFEDIIKARLQQRGEADPLFAETLKKQNKSIEECCRYITGEAHKLLKNGNCVVMSDDDVLALAVHYYDEDSIKVDSSHLGEHAVVEKHSKAVIDEAAKVELTDEERAEARKLAQQRLSAKIERELQEEREKRLNRRKNAKEQASEEQSLLFTFDDDNESSD